MAHPLTEAHPEFRRIARRYRRPIMSATLLLSAASMFALGVPLALKYMVEAYQAGGDYLAWGIGGAGILVATLGMQALGKLRATSISERLKARLRVKLYTILLGRDVGFHREHGPGDLMSALYTDLDQYSALYTTLLPTGIATVLIIGGALAALVRLDPALALVLLVAAAAVFIVMRLVLRKFRGMSRDLHERLSDIYKSINESLRQILVIKSFSLGPWASGRLEKKFAGVIDLNVRLQFYHGLLSLAVQLAMAAALLAGWIVLSQSQSIEGLGTQLSALLYGLLLVRQVGTAAGLVASYRRAQGAMDRLSGLLTRQREIPAPGRAGVPQLEKIDVHGLSFSYRDKPVLDRLELTLKAGETVALIGANGSGKTTLLNLLVGLETPPPGTVSWNGLDLRELDKEALRRRVAYLPQESLLSQATIAENLRMGKLDASDVELWQAAERAGVAEAIRRVEGDLGYLLGSEGSRLSGGEKRRLALARLLVRNDADLYLLDEPTEGLDPDSEQDILETALGALSGKAVLLVTHRTAVLQHVGRVLRLENGRLEEVKR